MHVRKLREEISAARELVDHQLHHVQQERSSVDRVLHVRHSTQVLEVKCLQLGERESQEDRESRRGRERQGGGERDREGERETGRGRERQGGGVRLT